MLPYESSACLIGRVEKCKQGELHVILRFWLLIQVLIKSVSIFIVLVIIPIQVFAAKYLIKNFKSTQHGIAPFFLYKNKTVLKNLDSVLFEVDDSNILQVEALEKLKSKTKVVSDRLFKYPRLNLNTIKNKNFLSLNLQNPGLPWGVLQINAPKVWELGEKGTHSKVVILDSGIDRDHEVIKNNFFKGKNFTSEHNPGPYDYFDNDGHGTHVAGTIAGRILPSGFAGVAPEAFLLSGRVCGAEMCSSLAIVEGIDWAISEKADVVNLSLGGNEITQEEADIVSKAIQHNLAIVAASGNDGIFEIEYPAKLPKVISVGASDSKDQRASFSQYGPELTICAPGVDVISSVPTLSAIELNAQALTDQGSFELNGQVLFGSGFISHLSQEVVYAGHGYQHEFKALTKGRIALIKRGVIDFQEKVENAVLAGAVGVIIYNNKNDELGGSLDQNPKINIPVLMISQSHGEKIMMNISKGNHVNVEIKMAKTSFDKYDGTSMATPHVSGVVALLKSLNKNLTIEQLTQIIKSTASPSASIQGECGSGIINAENAIMESLKY